MFSRLLPALLAGLAILAAPLAAGARDGAWPTYSNSEFGFSVQGPAEPAIKRFSQPVNGDSAEHVYVSYDLGNDSGMMVMVARFASGIPQPEAALQNAADGVAKGAKGRVTSRSTITVDGAPAVLMVLQPEDDYVLSDLLIVKGDTLYQLMSIGHGALPKETDAFQKSFTFLSSPQGSP